MSPRPERSGGPHSGSGRNPEAAAGLEERVDAAGAGRSSPSERPHRTPPPGSGPAAGGVEPEEPSSEQIADGTSALETAIRERDEYLEMLRRVQAEFENYKKRMLRQQTDLLERAAEGLVVRLLPAIDAFDLARAHLGESDELSAEGKALIQASSLLFDTLAKEGLERVADPGSAFDPTLHEAVEHEAAGEADDVTTGAGSEAGEPGTSEAQSGGPVVSAVLRSGYRWKGRVIRPAIVRVKG